MVATHEPAHSALCSDLEELFRIELSVAKRADELARGFATFGTAKRDREIWLLAEAQVLARARPAF